ncbi:Retrovirus-related Pol polyprotein from transposon 17.6 [Thelohanellus kitauei]|uniref:Retrovirus-related Pol polyprotein from transposon 17.6 n=1 Tax=Thelohanellus kitauei TaxID=669202 RepID=A0A0C2MUA3_THEKT|nr:Retrovirus-related Pol polyprotein from transposon 17.6 [Thelohanellus kitauei]
MNDASSNAKKALSEATCLGYSQTGAAIALTTDASSTAVGAAIEQRVARYWLPLNFFSRQLRPSELKYSAFDREYLALYLAIRHFRYYLEGRSFTVYTDHKCLTFVFSKGSDPWAARQQRQITAISKYTTSVKHIASKQNVVAGTLSRVKISSLSTLLPGIDYESMASEQLKDQEMLMYHNSTSCLILKQFPLGGTDKKLWCDISTGVPRSTVTTAWRRNVFNTIHGLSGPSIRSM